MFDQFSKADLLIFAYQDGSKDQEGDFITVNGDPMEIDRSMAAATSGELAAIVERCREFDEQGARLNAPEVVEQNMLRFVDAIRKSFKMKPLDRITGRGATAAMCVRVWNLYTDWQKKNQSPPA